MNTYILTEGRNFKTFLKDYAIALDSCYELTKEMLNMKLNLILIVLTGSLNFHIIAHSMNTLQFKQMISLTLCSFVILYGFSLSVYGGGKFL